MGAGDLYAQVLRDLGAEHDDLDAVVANLDDTSWELPTPAAGWSVRDQVGHLTFFDARAREAVTDPASFARAVEELGGVPGGEAAWVADHLSETRSLAPGELLSWWRAERAALLAALATADPGGRIPWYGPPMGPASFASARLMETWAHGQDVADALGVTRLPTPRLRHVAHLGVGARAWSFAVHGRPVPDAPVRVELRGPDRDLWTWGPPEAADVVRGPAVDFCLAVTQRRHPDDLHLDVEGPVAAEWMSIAQAFAGPPGVGRRPGQFRHTMPT